MFFQSPLAMFFALALLVAFFVVYPWVARKGFRVTSSKVVAVVFAAIFVLYARFLGMAVILVFPLSLIWFPEHWGNFTGFFQGTYISQKSPPMLVAFMGWVLLLLLPMLLMWMHSL